MKLMIPTKLAEQSMPYQDEGWWASVLAEEESQTAIPALKTQTTEEAGKPSPDWEKAMSLFHQDEIVSLVVTGHNRGGILVEADGLNGFVPCSHLLDMPVQPRRISVKSFSPAILDEPYD